VQAEAEFGVAAMVEAHRRLYDDSAHRADDPDNAAAIA
jgi:hypothetical protein